MPIKSYPIIPAKTWWALRNRFKLTMPPRISTHYLQSLLGVSEKAAKRILPHLKAIQLIDADGSINERTSLWRDDQQYAAVCEQIRQEVYPQKLLRSIPGPVIDTRTALEWFMKQTGVSANSAKKMTRFYQLLSKADCTENYRFTKTAHSEGELPDRTTGETSQMELAELGLSQKTAARAQNAVQLNIHIHIPSNASAAEINLIFSGISKHLKTLYS